jgi:hypothetical protein
MWRDLPRRILGPPHYGNAKKPLGLQQWGCKRGESTTAYSARKQVVEFYIFGLGTPKLPQTRRMFWMAPLFISSQRRIDVVFHFE